MVRLRYGTATEWTGSNPVLAAGECGLESDTNLMKFGDGATPWVVLPYVAGGDGGGTGGADEVWIGPSTPPSSGTELWYDTDAVGGSGLFVDSATFGLVGDGVADDTVALQAFLNSEPTKARHLRNGTYRTTTTLTIPDLEGYILTGESRIRTVIELDAANMPVLQTSSLWMHNYRLEHFTLKYKTPQVAANTDAVGFLIKGPPLATASAFFYSTLHDLLIDGARTGIGIFPNPTQYMSVWNNVFDTIHFQRTSFNLIYLISGSPGGHPVNTFRMITSISAPGTGPALHFSGVEFTIDGLDIEDWNGRIMLVDTGSGSIRGVHLERHVPTDYQILFEFAGGSWSLESYSISFAASAHQPVYIFQAVSGATLWLGGGAIYTSDLTPANAIALLGGSGGSKIEMPLPPTILGTASYYKYFPWEGTAASLTTNTGTVQWDMPSIPAGGMASKDVTVDGARAGDIVAVSMDYALPAGFQLTGAVATTDTVTATVVNHTAAAVDNGSGYLKARIWKAF
jgi:hypothetical protein